MDVLDMWRLFVIVYFFYYTLKGFYYDIKKDEPELLMILFFIYSLSLSILTLYIFIPNLLEININMFSFIINFIEQILLFLITLNISQLGSFKTFFGGLMLIVSFIFVIVLLVIFYFIIQLGLLFIIHYIRNSIFGDPHSHLLPEKK